MGCFSGMLANQAVLPSGSIQYPRKACRFYVEFDPSAIELMTPFYAEFTTSLNEMYMGYTDKELSLIERAFNDAADRQIAAARNI